MNKYQINLINRGTISFKSNNGDEKIDFDDKLIVYQNENYNIAGYKIVFKNQNIDYINYHSKKYTNKDDQVIVDFDFNDFDAKLIISFKNGLVDDCTIPISAVLSDKSAFDEKEKQLKYKELVKAVSLVINPGLNLINVFWKKSNPSVTKCILRVCYISDSEVEYLVLDKEVKGEYYSLTGLAYGKYSVILEEYIDDTLLISIKSEIILNDYLNNKLEEIKKTTMAISRNAGGNTVIIR